MKSLSLSTEKGLFPISAFSFFVFQWTEMLNFKVTECDVSLRGSWWRHSLSPWVRKNFLLDILQLCLWQWNLYSTQNCCSRKAGGRDQIFTFSRHWHCHYLLTTCLPLSSWCRMPLSSYTWFLFRCVCLLPQLPSRSTGQSVRSCIRTRVSIATTW